MDSFFGPLIIGVTLAIIFIVGVYPQWKQRRRDSEERNTFKYVGTKTMYFQEWRTQEPEKKWSKHNYVQFWETPNGKRKVEGAEADCIKNHHLIMGWVHGKVKTSDIDFDK